MHIIKINQACSLQFEATCEHTSQLSSVLVPKLSKVLPINHINLIQFINYSYVDVRKVP